MSKLLPGEQFAAPSPDDTSYFHPMKGNIIVKLKSGDTIRPPGGDPTPPQFQKH